MTRKPGSPQATAVARLFALLDGVRGKRTIRAVSEALELHPTFYGKAKRGESAFSLENLQRICGNINASASEIVQARRLNAAAKTEDDLIADDLLTLAGHLKPARPARAGPREERRGVHQRRGRAAPDSARATGSR